MITSLTPENRVTYEALNNLGQLSSLQVGPLTPIKIAYDSHGRISQIAQGSRTQKFAYNSQGNIASSTNALGQATSFVYDNANRVTKETLPDQNVIAMTYDKAGNLTSITPPGKTAHSFSYNLFELVGQYLPPSLGAGLSGATVYSYNLDRQLTQITQADGAQINFDYNSSTALLNSIVTPAGNYLYSYQPNSSLVSSITSPDGETTIYQRSGKILLSESMTGPVSGGLDYSYNADGTIAEMTLVGAKGTSVITKFANDNDGLLVQAGAENLSRNNFGAVTSSTLGKFSEGLSYDSFGQVIGDNSTWGRKSLSSVTYTRDSLGRIVNKKEGSDLEAYQYDQEGRLTGVLLNGKAIQTYSYDKNGNRIASKGTNDATASYDAQDRLIQYNQTEFKYNANGDLIEKIEHATKNPKITSYSYDVFGNLLSVTLPNGHLIEYVIDGQNRRVGKKVNGALTHGFIYQSQTQIVAELDAKGKIIKNFVYGEKANIPDYMIYQGVEYRIISDQVGTPEKIIDVATGAVVSTLNYDEFGREKSFSGAVTIPFGFAGGLKDSQTGLVRFGARDYNPEVGRWVNKDPIGFHGAQTDLYVYAANDPVNRADPSGLLVLDPGGIIPAWIKNTPIYQWLDSAAAVVVVRNMDLTDIDDFGDTISTAFGLVQNVGIDANANAGRDSLTCGNLTGLEDTILHEFNHAKLNLTRYSGAGAEDQDNLLLPILLQTSSTYKK